MTALLPLLQQTMGLVRHPEDGGPIYYETKLDQLIQEPWNGISAFIFLFIVGYWFWHLRGQYRTYLFMTWCIPILAIGGVGGTIYHLFRLHPFFMYMDWVPILMLCLAATGYFINRLTGTRWKGIVVVVTFFVFQFALVEFTERIEHRFAQYAINVNYVLMASLILVPALLVLRRVNGRGGRFLLLATVMFALALGFRLYDTYLLNSFLDNGGTFLQARPGIGTHFLWHAFGALACHFIFHFVYIADTAHLESRGMHT